MFSAVRPCGLEQTYPSSRQTPHIVSGRPKGMLKTSMVKANPLLFGYFSHHQATLLEAKNPEYVTKTQCRYTLTPWCQPAGSFTCGTMALAAVLNAMQPQQQPITSKTLDCSIRRWKSGGVAPNVMMDEARRRGLFAQSYNHGSLNEVKEHLAQGHVVVILQRLRTQYHYELIQAVGQNAQGEPLVTTTDGLEKSQQKATKNKGFKTYTQQEFVQKTWQRLKTGVFEKGESNAYVNIPTGHDCYYLVFSTTDDLAKPTPYQQGPWTDAAAAWLNRWANRVAKGLNGMMKPLGLHALRERWFGAAV